MEEITAVAAAETIEVLYNTEICLVAKIPYSILKALEDKAEEYTGKIKLDMTLGLDMQQISLEAQAILAIIYRDYWCTDEKRREIDRFFEFNIPKSDENNQLNFSELTDEKDNKDSEDKEEEKKSLSSKLLSQDIEINDNKELNQEKNEKGELIQFHRKWYIVILNKVKDFFKRKLRV